MKTLTYTAEQIVKILEQDERPGQTVAAISREYDIAEATFYRWRKTYAGTPLPEVLRLKELEKENSRLKRLLVERMLEIDLLKDLLGKTVTITDRRAAVHVLIAGDLSAHRACRLASISRATFRSRAHPEDDTAVIAQMQELAYRYPRYGYRRMTALLRQTQRINQKRVRRLWRQGVSTLVETQSQ